MGRSGAKGRIKGAGGNSLEVQWLGLSTLTAEGMAKKKKNVPEKPVLLSAKFEWIQRQRWYEACKDVDSARSDRG